MGLSEDIVSSQCVATRARHGWPAQARDRWHRCWLASWFMFGWLGFSAPAAAQADQDTAADQVTAPPRAAPPPQGGAAPVDEQDSDRANPEPAPATVAPAAEVEAAAAGPDDTLPPPAGPAPPDAAEDPTRPDIPPVPDSYRVPPPPPGVRYPGPAAVSDPEQPGTPGEIELPSRIGTRLRVLSTDLEALASHGGPALTNGILSVVTGGLSIALGALLDEDSLSSFLYVFGAASIARGTVDLIFSPNPDEVALQFSHMPMRNVEEVKLRLRFGERALTELADDSRVARILDGSLSVAAGVAALPLVLVPLQEDDREIEALDVFVIIGASISILSGVVSLVTPSEAERRDKAYRGLKERLRHAPKPRPPDDSRPEVSVFVGPNSAAFTLGYRF